MAAIRATSPYFPPPLWRAAREALPPSLRVLMDSSERLAIRVTRLPNGLTVVSETMRRVETVLVGAYVGVGTRHEAPEVNGVSHFLEHMAFKGTASPSSSPGSGTGISKPWPT